MASIEQIRRVVTRYESSGAEKAIGDLNALAAAEGSAARAGETLGTTTDSLTRRQLSAAAAYERLKRSIDEEYRAQQQLARGQATLERAMEQGIIDTHQYAAALDQLKAKTLQPAVLVAPSANDNVKLAAHEVSNLAAQISDLGIQLASGQSPFMAMVQQGPQIAAVMGDRGVKGIILGIGSALASLVTPTTLILGGLVVGGYALSAVFSALSDDTEDLSDVLERSAKTADMVRDAYDGAAGAAGEFTTRSRELLTLQANADLSRLQKQMQSWQQGFLSTVTQSNMGYDPMGNYTGVVTEEVQARFAAFAAVIEDFRADVAAGGGDVAAFADEIAKLANADGATAEMRALAEEIIKNVEAGLELQEAIAKASATVAQLAGNASAAQKELLGLRAAADAKKVLQDLERDISRAGDERAQFVGRYADDLIRNLGAENPLVQDVIKGANALYDVNQRVSASNKAREKSARDAERAEQDMLREAQRYYEQTRTAAESYADEMARLNELLAAGAVTQDVYARAAAKAAEALAEAEKAAQYDLLSKSNNPLDGLKLGTIDYFESIGTEAQQVGEIVTNTYETMEDAFAAFATGSKVEFSDLVDSMIADAARFGSRQLIAGLFGGSGGGLGGLIGSILGIGGGGGYTMVTGGAGPYAVPTFHEGGMGVGEASGFRAVDPEVFASALRFHSGRTPWGPGEMPAIIKNDEAVFTARRLSALREGRGMYAAATAPPADLKVVVNTLPGETADVQRRPDGSVQVDMRRMVRDEMTAAFDDGYFDQLGATRYGWRRGDLG